MILENRNNSRFAEAVGSFIVQGRIAGIGGSATFWMTSRAQPVLALRRNSLVAKRHGDRIVGIADVGRRQASSISI